MSEKENDLMTIKQLSVYLQVPRGTISNWVSARKIPCIKISGRHLRFRKSDIETFLSERSQEARV